MKKEEIIMKYYQPIVKKWELQLSKFEDGGIEAEKTFANYLFYSNENSLNLPGFFRLSGHVYNKNGFKDGDKILTSNLESVERVSLNNEALSSLLENDEFLNKETIKFFAKDDASATKLILGKNELLCAITSSGSRYYFFAQDCTPSMFLLLGALTHSAG